MRLKKPEIEASLMQLPRRDNSPAVYTDDLAVARAQQLGLPGTQQLREAIVAGAGAARSVNADHPPAYRGQRMWAETVEMLRKALRPAGWEREDLNNIPLVVHRTDPVIMIAVAAGDGNTGSEHHADGPILRYTKGEFSTTFYNGDLEDLWTRTEGSDYQVWLLVHHLYGPAVRAELSKPTSLDARGQVVGWDERILVPEIGFGPDASRSRTPERPNSPTITPDVRRRNAS